MNNYSERKAKGLTSIEATNVVDGRATIFCQCYDRYTGDLLDKEVHPVDVAGIEAQIAAYKKAIAEQEEMLADVKVAISAKLKELAAVENAEKSPG